MSYNKSWIQPKHSSNLDSKCIISCMQNQVGSATLWFHAHLFSNSTRLSYYHHLPKPPLWQQPNQGILFCRIFSSSVISSLHQFTK